ncbi:MAG: hypothetical protein F6K48_03260 [Okeania sp. SIO3H1]|nr:hypothetical protein [Okeania sp. SIO3H1]
MIYYLWRKIVDFKRHTLTGIKRWHYSRRPPPYKTIPGADPLGNDHGEHDIIFVSRHDIAECGLKCENCKTISAERGDFSAVVETQHGEAIHCNCGKWLVASPDTDHGDHLIEGPIPPEFYKFKRISPKQALKEQYGEDAVTSDGQIAVKRMKLSEVASELGDPSAKKETPANKD